MTLKQTSEMLGLSDGPTKRSWSRYQQEGDLGLVHGLRGEESNRQADGVMNGRAHQPPGSGVCHGRQNPVELFFQLVLPGEDLQADAHSSQRHAA